MSFFSRHLNKFEDMRLDRDLSAFKKCMNFPRVKPAAASRSSCFCLILRASSIRANRNRTRCCITQAFV